MLPLWPPPSSDRQPQFGRVTGHEPYDNRYQWGTTVSTQYSRLVVNPEMALGFTSMLGLEAQVIVHAEARAALGGEVAMQGEPAVSSAPAANGLLVRDIDGENFGRDLVATQVSTVHDPEFASVVAPVTVSLSTDWTTSGSNTLLDELKVADIALRDPRILGRSRHEVPALRNNRALDRLLVDMVTRNPARTLRWPIGEITPGRYADVLLLDRPADSPTGGMPDSPYRNLIDATERDVHLVLVGGRPVAVDVGVMRSLLGRAIQLVRSPAGHYVKALAQPLRRATRTVAAAIKRAADPHQRAASTRRRRRPPRIGTATGVGDVQLYAAPLGRGRGPCHDRSGISRHRLGTDLRSCQRSVER